MNWPTQERWLRLWHETGASGAAAHWYENLTQAYSEPQRRYHNQQHIAECLLEFDEARHLAGQPTAIELALWFHDAVYNPKASDNEERSAAMAGNCLEGSGLPELAATVCELIMATKSHQTNAGADAALMLDVDLSILGRDEKRFAEYEAQIREEYSFVPRVMFSLKRAEILEGFLARERIYATEFFAGKYERRARENLKHSIDKLKCL